MMPFQYLITSSGVSGTYSEADTGDYGIDQFMPENFEDACLMAYEHCKDAVSIRVLRIDRDTSTFVDQTNEVAYWVALNLLDRRDEEHGFPEWAAAEFNSLDIVLEGEC
jgi:hypothetical protein|tara:strand:+ start:510 stop:836 length:327 start_codon:yes stop_codon:yes gene_type:complete